MTWGNSNVGARAPETKVTVCAQTVAARWAGCCWAPVYPSGWVAKLMWAEWACGQWLQGWVVGVWLGWLAERWCWRESSRNKSDGAAGDQGCAVGGVWFVGCGLGRLGGLCTGLIAPQGQVSETSRCHRGSRCTLALHNGVIFYAMDPVYSMGHRELPLRAGKHANGAVGWACPAGTMWHTFGWWAVAGPRAVPEKVRIWESSRCHRETRSTLALSIGAIAIATPQLPLYLWSIY
ncbi:uncharacterized protein MONOS_17533 [Monocercomonoides exilis]|uniref:uncharacterized protein n=1 Tax=Monocercomonoides exilis TaxID=2049356 RepID=UPI00355A4BEC|nr:hypothetical protein MONOS_18428 [Monocercomonoides exilis]KAH7814762.1 hypothetical protein MONOS_18429 [Monocercomonoides exilis]KAH7823807.1 hypothetical protein MONOS_17533 [Monocercomonoides exilis]